MNDRGPLAGLRVLELGHLIAGPFCGQLLGDFGAEVIKIEPPEEGDPMRLWGLDRTGGIPAWFAQLSRNKRSVTLNLKSPEGQGLLMRLVEVADVLIENFRPGRMEAWGLGYSALSAVNPGLVMVRVSGFGQTGPYAGRPGYGSIAEAMGGLRYVTGDPDRIPSRVGVSIGDSLAGMFGAIGALIAIHARSKTGRGQVVDVALYESVLSVMESLIADYSVAGYIRERSGPILPGLAPSNLYRTVDDSLVIIAANQDSVFARLAAAMDMPDLAEDARFRDHASRGAHQAELDEIIDRWAAGLTREQIEDLLVEASVPVGGVLRAPEIISDPHVAARDALSRVSADGLGEVLMPAPVPKLSDTPGSVTSVGPILGEGNEAVWRQLVGLTESQMNQLSAKGVI